MYDTKYHNQDLSKFSFLITGGAGFIGANLVEYLLKYNAGNVVVLDNLSNGHLHNISCFLELPNFKFIEGDIRDYDTCKKALNNIDFVLHQAALGSVPRSVNDPITTNEVNITGFLNMLTAVKEVKTIKKMVYAASSSTYGDSEILPKAEDVIGNPLSPYAITKYVNELYADVYSKTYGLHTVGLRYFNVFGPKQDPSGAYAAVIPLFFNSGINNEPIHINGDGEQTRDFTFIENVVQANMKAVFSSLDQHEIFNVAFGKRVSVNKLWETIQELTNSNSQVSYKPVRLGDVRDSLANIDKAKSMLTYSPLFSLNNGLKETYNWFKSQNKLK